MAASGSRVALMRLDYLVVSTCITTIGVLSLLHELPTCVLLLVVSAASILLDGTGTGYGFQLHAEVTL